jgi:uncharacterized protein
MKKPLVIFHFPCLDGFTAAWACWLKHPDWEFVPGVHGSVVPLEQMADRDVYFLDFSYKRPIMEQIVKVAKSVFVIDHHVTAIDDLKELFEKGQITGLFNVEKSGAHLAWKWFHDGVPVPFIVQLVEDRDLWREPRRYPETEPFTSYLFSIEYGFERFCQIYKDSMNESLFIDMCREGNAILRKHDKDTKELVEKVVYKGFVGGLIVPIANLPYQYSSSAGHIMSKGVPFAATYFFDGDKYIFSLRSADDGIDVSEIAKKYGGGGHKHSAGFQIRSLEEL